MWRGCDDVALEVHARVGERRLARDPSSVLSARSSAGFVGDDLHPDAAAAADRLDDDRVADARPPPPCACASPSGVSMAIGSSVPGTGLVPAASATCRAFILSPKASSTAGGGPMNVTPARATASREPALLAQEAVARVDGAGARLLDGGEDGVDVEVRVLGRRRADEHGLVGVADVRRVPVRLRVDGDGAHPEALARAHDAAGDLAAVGDEDLVEEGHEAFHDGGTPGVKSALAVPPPLGPRRLESSGARARAAAAAARASGRRG